MVSFQRMIFLAAVVLLVVGLSGCSTGKSKGPVKSNPYIGGTQGLLIEFGDGNPPPEVYDGGDFPFDITVKLENKGEFTVPRNDVQVKITGIRAQEFGVSEGSLTKSPDEDVEGREKNAEGGIRDGPPVYVEFSGLNRREKLSGNTEYTIRADVCYTYKTFANSKICVRENNLDVDEGVCAVNEVKTVYNSGAPVQIKDFKEVPRARNKIGFDFTVEKAANGEVYKKGTKCADIRANEDKVWVEVKTGIPGLECSGLKDGTSTTGYITLYGGSRIVTCVQTVDTNSDYEAPVDITLVYDWEDLKETKLLVKHSTD